MSYYNLTFSNLSSLEQRQLPIVRASASDVPRRAIETLTQGGVVVYPTDTVYGVGCRIDDDAAVRRVFALKGRPHTEALPVLLAEVAQLDQYARDVPPAARRLVSRFWPGALTVVVRRSERVPSLVAGGGPTVALRVPNHPVPRALVRAVGVPIVGTSANTHGMPSPVTAQLAVYDLGDRVDLVLDGGRVPGGRESTVVDVTSQSPRVVRQGAILAKEIESLFGGGR
ncbi:MAG: threonylcarbamoyl-AMP synthase [Armatimonadetes bacterium]|nr:threonylcarbamoyl-AMP synthase [Armatimonadota bacterium]